jgi:hypothetical protein
MLADESHRLTASGKSPGDAETNDAGADNNCICCPAQP